MSITVLTSDNQQFALNKNLVQFSGTISNIILDVGEFTNEIIPLPNTNGKTLEYLILLMQYYIDHPVTKSETKTRTKLIDMPYHPYNNELKDINDEDLILILISADNLEVSLVLHDTFEFTANTRITGKSKEEIQKFLNIKNDIESAELVELEKDLTWMKELK
jgi:hypothetical protein